MFGMPTKPGYGVAADRDDLEFPRPGMGDNALHQATRGPFAAQEMAATRRKES